MKRWIAGALCALPMLAFASQERVLDAFDSAQGWTVIQSDQVTGTLRNDGKATCLDYDFRGVSGYVGLQKPIAIDYPGNYAFAFKLRGEGPKNDFQFKLVDASGDNVWWATKPKFALPAEWTPMQFRKRHISKAWGPSEEKALTHSAKLEFTLASGEGGKGTVCFDALVFAELPPVDDSPLIGKLTRKAASATLDLGKVREFGGVILTWKPSKGYAHSYRVALSDDGSAWRPVHATDRSDGEEDPIALPESAARFVRVDWDNPEQLGPHVLDAIAVQPLAFGATPNDFIKAVAARAPRGTYPRGFSGEQPYWTIVGVDGGKDQGLIDEDGAIEVGKGSFSIVPEVWLDPGSVTWADVDKDLWLQDGYLPIPAVRWKHDDFTLEITAFADGTPENARLVARYKLTNTGTSKKPLQLMLRARPFQVNPPSQFLNTVGGVSEILEVEWRGQVLHVNGVARVAISDHDINQGTERFDAGMAFYTGPEHDATGLAGAFVSWPATLAPGESIERAWTAPLGDGTPVAITVEEAARAQDRVAAQWHDKLDRVQITVPKEGQHIVDTLRTALAHMAISRVGPRLQPGTRSYSRAWIRDGAMIGEGLLRLGREDIAKDFLRWYAPYQFDSGKVPCCVDDRGADPVPENDSHGELIYLVSEIYRYTRDRALLEKMWPHVLGAVKYMDQLRASERTEENRAKNPAFYGLMPASISHEGYSAKPMHSYWDDFWALRGYKDAVEIATWLGKDDDAKRFAASRDQFRDDLYASIRAAMTAQKIDFIPGSAELGDFDATSTTIALAPGGEQDALPRAALLATFERYWREFEQRAHDQREWKDYTPYELRTIGTFVRLGWKDRAHEALAFFFDDQQPRAWNQWAEVVSRTPRKPFFVGDLPHAWVASDYVRSALDLFAYERGDQIVLAAGIPDAWLEGEGVAIDGLRTPGGPLAYTLRADDTHVILEITRGTPPPGGFVFPHKGTAHVIAKVPGVLKLPR